MAGLAKPPAGEDAGSGTQDAASTDVLGEVIEALTKGIALFDEAAMLVRCNESWRKLNARLADILAPGISWEIFLRELVQRGELPRTEADRLRAMEQRLAMGGAVQAPLAIELPGGARHEIAMRPTVTGGFVVTQQDVSRQREYEDGVNEADLLLRKVLEACPANVMMSRVRDGRIIYRSPAATEQLGAIHQIHEHFAFADDRGDFITALLPDGRVEDMRVTGLRPDGSHFPCLISARLIDYRGEEVMVSSTVDISKEIALRKTLSEQREQLFQSEKMSALGELLAGVAHELNNPLSVVVGHALMMREEADDPEMLRRIGKISEAAERCARIVKSFLAMARQQPLKLAPMDLNAAVTRAMEAMRQVKGSLKARVELDLAPDLAPVEGDEHQIIQIVINLVVNAEQAISGSGKGNCITVSTRNDPSAAMAELAVTDNGPGIPEAIRGRIFDPLFTTKAAGEGTGIGLAFCQRLVTAHSGTIAAEPIATGARLVVRLPLSRSAGQGEWEQEAATNSAVQGRVLVVDDEQDVAQFIREVLVKDGFAVDSATSAEEALALVRSHSYLAVLSDLNMPGLAGRGLYDVIGREMPKLAARVAFITGDTMSAQARAFLDSAGCPFLEKPVAPAELRKLVHSIVSGQAQKGAAP